jgi:hypothetical protein
MHAVIAQGPREKDFGSTIERHTVRSMSRHRFHLPEAQQGGQSKSPNLSSPRGALRAVVLTMALSPGRVLADPSARPDALRARFRSCHVTRQHPTNGRPLGTSSVWTVRSGHS